VYLLTRTPAGLCWQEGVMGGKGRGRGEGVLIYSLCKRNATNGLSLLRGFGTCLVLARVSDRYTSATHYCNTLLQHTPATHYCNTLLQHTNIDEDDI